MVGKLQPLVDNQRIIRTDGTPTEYFIRWAQQRQIDIGQAVSEERALEIVTEFVLQFIADNPLLAGSGIDLSPSGILSDGVTISALVQEILDQISTVHGTVLFRGATEWEALAPGTAGDFLQTAGPGADPAWAAAGGGGGVQWTEVARWDHAVSGNTAPPLDFTSLGTFSELMIVFDTVAINTSVTFWLRLSTNNGVNYSTAYRSYSNNNATNQNVITLFTLTGTGAGMTKVITLTNCDVQPASTITPGGTGFMLLAETTPVNAIRLGSTGTPLLTGGIIKIFTR